MKTKLNKKAVKMEHSIESYSCSCTCGCSHTCSCSCSSGTNPAGNVSSSTASTQTTAVYNGRRNDSMHVASRFS